jgi:pimeloyl-ACP methyl ester carboxylesterase
MSRAAVAVVVAFAVLAPASVAAADETLACGQSPGSRFFWLERGFCDLERHGPEKALGVVIWNHGLSSTTETYRAPVPPVLRLLQARGWDVVKINRNNLGEGAGGSGLRRAVERTLEEVATQRGAGYRRVVLAGQSFGGLITLEAAETSGDVFAAVAMAPGVRSGGAAGSLDANVTDRILSRMKTERIALVFPKDDALFGKIVRGERAATILTARRAPFLLLDETSGLSGHGGGTGGRMTLRYGLCLADFLSAPELPPSRHTCGPADDVAVARELLPPWPRDASLLTDDRRPGASHLIGAWYGLLEETIVGLGLAEHGGAVRLVYQWRTQTAGTVIRDVDVRDGQLHARLSNGATLVVSAEKGEVVTAVWTSADRARVIEGRLRRAPLPGVSR